MSKLALPSKRLTLPVALVFAELWCSGAALGQVLQDVYPLVRRPGGISFEGRQGGGWVTNPAESHLVEFRTFPSRAVGTRVSYHVFLPKQYSSQPRRRFPVIYWLHGSGPGVRGIPALAQFFADAMDNGEMPPAIVVFPNGLPDGMWVNSKDGRRPVESMVVRELLPLIDAQYRTIASRVGRVVQGFSMGGYGAGRLGLKYADKFRALAMYGAGPLQRNFLDNDPNLKPLETRRRIFQTTYGSDSNYFLANSPWQQAQTRRTSLPADFRIRLVVGQDDHQVLKGNVDFHKHLTSLGIDHSFQQIPGVGHNPQQLLAADRHELMEFYRDVLQ